VGSLLWAALLLLLPGILPATARASESPLRVHGGLGAGLMISDDQLGYLGYDGVASRSWLALGGAVTSMLIVEGHAALGVFGSSGQDGGLLEVGGGLRLDLLTPIQRVRFSPAAHLDLGVTGDKVRPTVSVGVALMLELSRAWSMGPMLQYGHVIQPDDDGNSSDARYFTFGVAAGYRPVTRQAAPQRAARRATLLERSKAPAPPSDASGPAPQTPIEPSDELMVLLESAVTLVADESKLIAPVLFQRDSVEFIPCGEAALFAARDVIARRRGAVIVEGHADTDGTPAYNTELALRRAQAVRDWLVAQGVSPGRLSVRSHGESTTLALERDDSRRQINRRVVIYFEEAP